MNARAVFLGSLGKEGRITGIRNFATGFTLPVDAAPEPDGALCVLEFGGVHNLWDITAIPNGPHTLTFRVYDTRGPSAEASVTVIVVH